MSVPLSEANQKAVDKLQSLMNVQINHHPIIRSWYAMVASDISLKTVAVHVRLYIANLNKLNGKVLEEIDVDRKLAAKFRDIIEEEIPR